MVDPRIEKLASGLIEYSCAVKQGEKVLIDVSGVPTEMTVALVNKVYSVGGFPFVENSDPKIKKALLNGVSEDMLNKWAEYDSYRMKDMDAYIGIRGGNNSMELSDVDENNIRLYSKLYLNPVHYDLRVNGTKWVILRWPTDGMSQLAKMSTEAFEDLFFEVCTLNYGKMDKAMDALADLIVRTDKVRITARDTDISFSIKGIGAQKCSGQCNIPDGEVYTAPIKNSVNGFIHYNTPSIYNGIEFKDVKLTFKDGKIIEATGNDSASLNKIFDTDDGARYVGEFAFGVNPYITKPMGDILFDEKISGSIHFTPGSCYTDCDNGNQSSVHWDLVLIQTPEYGGGEIYFDDVLIRKDGKFVLPELYGLNPENLI